MGLEDLPNATRNVSLMKLYHTSCVTQTQVVYPLEEVYVGFEATFIENKHSESIGSVQCIGMETLSLSVGSRFGS